MTTGTGDGASRLATVLAPEQAPALADVLAARSARLVAVAGEHLDQLEGPSALPGWSRLVVLADLRYVAQAMGRMTIAALEGRSEEMYPGGRAAVRPATLVPGPGEGPEDLVASLHAASVALDELWSGLSAPAWALPREDPDLGAMELSTLLVMRLTEIEVHGTDLALPRLGRWDDRFVRAVLPLRLAWLQRARHLPTADQAVEGSWLLTDGERHWLVCTSGARVAASAAHAGTAADCGLQGSPHDLLALVLGREPAGPITATGDEALARAFKRAFPGP